MLCLRGSTRWACQTPVIRLIDVVAYSHLNRSRDLTNVFLFKDTDQQQSLIVLLHAVLLHFMHYQIPKLPWRLGCVLTQQLFQSP